MHDVREKVAGDDLPVRLSERACSTEIGAFCLAEGFSSDEASEADPTGDAEGDGHGADAFAEDHEDGDEHEDFGNRGDGAVDVLDEVIDFSSEISCEDSEKHTDGDVDGAGETADEEGGSCAFE